MPKITASEAGLERKYLKWFIAVLLIGIVTGVCLNIYYDLKAHKDITILLRELFASAKAGEAEKFVRKSYIADAYIYGDLDAPEISARENGLSELYTEIVSGGMTLQSVSFVKTVERLAVLTSISATDSKGAQRQIYLVLIKETDRQKKERWLPYRLLAPERNRKEIVSRTKELLDADAVRKEVIEDVLGAVSYVDLSRERAFVSVASLLSSLEQIMTQVRMQAEFLVPLVPDEVIRNEFVEALRKTPENLDAALKSLVSPRSKFRNFIARLKAVSDAKPEEAKETAERSGAAAAQLQGSVDSLFRTIKLCALPPDQRRGELLKRIAQLNSQFVPAEFRTALAQKLEEAQSRPEIDLKTIFTEVRGAAFSPQAVFEVKKEAVAVVIRKRGIPPQMRDELLKKLDGLPQDADFRNFGEEFAEVASSEEAMRFSFLSALSGPSGYVGQVIALQSTQDYVQEIVKAAKYEASISTSSILTTLELDSSQPADIYGELISDLREVVTKVKNSAVAPERNMRRRTEALVAGLPDVWAMTNTEEEFLNWAFPEGAVRNSALVKEAKDFFAKIKGRKVEIANIYQWYDRYLTSTLLIVRVLLDSDKYGKWVDEKYEETKAKYEEAKKNCREAKKGLEEAQRKYKEGDKEYRDAKETYERSQKEHRDAKERYEQARREQGEAEEKREYAVLPLILVQKMSPDWGLAWSPVRVSSVYYDDYKGAVISAYDEEMNRREKILSLSR